MYADVIPSINQDYRWKYKKPQQCGNVNQFNQLEMVTTFTYKPSLVRRDARNFELSW